MERGHRARARHACGVRCGPVRHSACARGSPSPVCDERPARRGHARQGHAVKPVARWSLVVGAFVVGGVLIGRAPFGGRTREGDKSCHNPFADGAKRVSAILRLDLKLSNDAWPELTDELVRFGRDLGWSIRNTSQVQPGVAKTWEISLCRSDRLSVFVNELRWATDGYAPASPGLGIPVNMYGEVPPDAWQPVARDLVHRLEARWPGKVRFKNGDGYEVEPPAFLNLDTH
jgi:hypothetical protein